MSCLRNTKGKEELEQPVVGGRISHLITCCDTEANPYIAVTADVLEITYKQKNGVKRRAIIGKEGKWQIGEFSHSIDMGNGKEQFQW